MKPKRNRLEIIRDILTVIKERNGKINRTQLMAKSNLSYEMMGDYLNELIEKGFVATSEKSFLISDKGRNYLEKYALVTDFLMSFGLE